MDQVIREMEICNYSPITIITYSSLLRMFLNYSKKEVAKITSQDLKDYIYYRLKKDSISVSTVNQIISAWKIVHVNVLGKKWEGCKIVRPRREKKLPIVLSQDKAKQLLKTSTNKKHCAMLYVLYSTGIRCNELLSLKLLDVDSARMILNIRQGKGKKKIGR